MAHPHPAFLRFFIDFCPALVVLVHDKSALGTKSSGLLHSRSSSLGVLTTRTTSGHPGRVPSSVEHLHTRQPHQLSHEERVKNSGGIEAQEKNCIGMSTSNGTCIDTPSYWHAIDNSKRHTIELLGKSVGIPLRFLCQFLIQHIQLTNRMHPKARRRNSIEKLLSFSTRVYQETLM
jgi:hypothetical protein